MSRSEISRKVLLAAGLFLTLYGVGIAAFVAGAGEPGIEAAFRSFSAITTTSLVSDPATTLERVLTATLTLLAGLFYLAVVASVVHEVVSRNLLAEVIHERRVQKVSKQDGHYIVCGYGNVGRAVTRDLLKQGKRVVVIDPDGENVRAAEALRVTDQGVAAGIDVAIEGEAEHLLDKAGLQQARGLVACVGSDAKNLYIALIARKTRPDIFIAARAADDHAREHMEALPRVIDTVTSPYASAGHLLASAVIQRCSVSDLSDRAADQNGAGLGPADNDINSVRSTGLRV